MPDNDLELFVKKTESLGSDVQLLRQQLDALGNFTGRDNVSAMVNYIQKQVDDIAPVREAFLRSWSAIEEKKKSLDEEIAMARKLHEDPVAWMEEQKKRMDEQWAQIEAERARLKNNQQEIRDAANLLQSDKDKRARLKKEISLWMQNMLVFVGVIILMLVLSAVVPAEYRTPVIISMGIFAVFPFMAVAVATYNILRY